MCNLCACVMWLVRRHFHCLCRLCPPPFDCLCIEESTASCAISISLSFSFALACPEGRCWREERTISGIVAIVAARIAHGAFANCSEHPTVAFRFRPALLLLRAFHCSQPLTVRAGSARTLEHCTLDIFRQLHERGYLQPRRQCLVVVICQSVQLKHSPFKSASQLLQSIRPLRAHNSRNRHQSRRWISGSIPRRHASPRPEAVDIRDPLDILSKSTRFSDAASSVATSTIASSHCRQVHLRHQVEHLRASELEVRPRIGSAAAIEVFNPLEALQVPAASSAATVVTTSAAFLVGGDRQSHSGAHHLEKLSKSLGIDNHVLINNHQLRSHVRHTATRGLAAFHMHLIQQSSEALPRQQHETMRIATYLSVCTVSFPTLRVVVHGTTRLVGFSLPVTRKAPTAVGDKLASKK